jgi:hypothetical protein
LCVTVSAGTTDFEKSLEDARDSRLPIEHWRGFARRLGVEPASALDPLRFARDSQSDSEGCSRGA